MIAISNAIRALIDKARLLPVSTDDPELDSIRAKLRDATFQMLWDDMAAREPREARIWSGLESVLVMQLQTEKSDGPLDPEAIPYDPITELEPLAYEDAQEIRILDDDDLDD